MTKEEFNICSCGCGQQIKRFDIKGRERRYALGHFFKGKKIGIETTTKRLKTIKEKYGKLITWNKGLKGEDYLKHYKGGKVWNKDKTHPKYKGYIELVRKIGKNNKGKKRSQELKESMSLKHKGQVPPTKGKTYEEYFGEEKARKIKEHFSKVRKIKSEKGEWVPPLKNKKFEEFYGEKAKEMRENLSQKLENNPNWRGGLSFEPYTKEFNERFRNAIRKRDNQICMNCGVHREKLKNALDVHHVNYDKKLSVIENCIGLCSKCHLQTNFNREYWIKLFQEKLSKLYGYEYKNGNIIVKLANEVKNE